MACGYNVLQRRTRGNVTIAVYGGQRASVASGDLAAVPTELSKPICFD